MPRALPTLWTLWTLCSKNCYQAGYRWGYRWRYRWRSCWGYRSSGERSCRSWEHRPRFHSCTDQSISKLSCFPSELWVAGRGVGIYLP